ncbi:hypothetical protein AX16_001788 [Volvariella volvacea WC 439]|nr:hypothetical protein AX16_001788 [Volvariella volvacea WC 439]
MGVLIPRASVVLNPKFQLLLFFCAAFYLSSHVFHSEFANRYFVQDSDDDASAAARAKLDLLPDNAKFPPTYERLRKWEDNLPQHNLSLAFPEGKKGRYVKFSCQIRLLGWNNVLNEVLMNAHLAYESKRAYVFQDYYWKPDYYPWPRSRYEWPPRTPLNALIAGPTAGGPWEPGDNSPRSISEPWFDVVCPPSERLIIHTRDVKSALNDADGIDIFNAWKKILLEAKESCVEIVPADRSEDNFPQVFDLWLWGSKRVLSLWEGFSKSPTSRLLDTSYLVKSVVARNEYLFLPRGPRNPKLDPPTMNPYDRMMAMHIRRGDFKQACLDLAYWNSTFYSWNLMPSLPDPLVFPEHLPWGSEGYNHIVLGRCLPDMNAIVRKARVARDEYLRDEKIPKGTVLDVMYLLTNERGQWVEKMKELLRLDGWTTIVTSNDLELDAEGWDVNMAVDMEIARLAAVFIGNGWSSFTSNINHRRFVDGKPPISIRFW